ncbi:uncharacterized protein LOC110452657 [Mizuhopecten yessoensis]|uniref:Endonuclease/exonuclease/phosphatase domain-containing protein n=1 Tax=Mizuhopecten yessoensis TaxID=6573 RepID=A0A210QJ61_MIZYE|nr:uncharacterized protein LOC110452657 [Mizuhopecten yessoensis]OWF48749.1 hypothetical protein KP79_PYT11966 [Mizuhopecten yessoensis]
METRPGYLAIILGSVYVNVVLSYDITVATCNLWNVMFNWNVRKYRIAQMITDAKPDVVAFQEVRFHVNGGGNQIMELQELLPDYKWRLFREANKVQKPKGAHWLGWEKEGIGILSRKPITLFSTHTLPAVPGPDINNRGLIIAKIFISPEISVQVAALHLSYERRQQCGNTKSVIELIRDQESSSEHLRSIVLGDFNTYNDFDWPVKLFTLPNQKTLLECHIQDEKFLSLRGRSPWSDVWEMVGHPSSGRTFSNMPTPGYASRPDRILATSNFKPHGVHLQGNGTIYKSHYYQRIVTERLRTLLHSSYLSWYGVTGYPCFHDCGPRGYCRCGVCVRGDNPIGTTCTLPECEECSSRVFIYIVIFVILNILTVIHLFYAVVCLLISGADFKGEAVFAILGCNCCLCNPDNFRPLNFNSRKF